MNEKLKAIAEEAADSLQRLIKESSEDILSSWDKVVEESQLAETPAKLSLGFTVTVDIDNNKVTHKLAWSHRTVREVTTEIPDPEQIKLSLEE